MALQKQHIPVLLGPLDQKSDSKTTMHGRLTKAMNVVKFKPNEYRKRNGRTAVGQVGTPSGTLYSIWQGAAYRRGLMSLGKAGGGALWGLSDTSGKWGAPGTADAFPIRTYQRGPVISKRFPVASDAAANYIPDVAVSGDYALVAWEQNGSVIEVVYDLAKETQIAVKKLTGWHPRLEVIGTTVLLVYENSANDLIVREWTSAALAAGAVALETNVVNGTFNVDANRFDTVTQDGKLSIAALSTVPDIQIIEYTLTTGATVVTTTTTAGTSRCIGWLKNLGGAAAKRFLGTCNSTDGVQVKVINAAGAVDATHTIDTDAATDARCRSITGHTTGSSTSGTYNILYELAADDTAIPAEAKHDAKILYCEVTAGTPASVVTLVRSVGLRSKTFAQGSDYYFLATYNSDTHPSYFLFRVETGVTSTTAGTECPQLKLLAGRGNGGSTAPYFGTEDDSGLTNVTAHGSNKWILAVPQQAWTMTIGGTESRPTTIDMVELEFDPTTNAGRPIEAADSLLVPAGQLLAFDGVQYHEFGYCTPPETPTVAVTVGGGSMEAGDRTVITVFRRTDAHGRIHRSPPSPPSATFTTAANDRITVTAPTLRLSGRAPLVASDDDCVIEVYLTAAAGTVYYLAQTINNDQDANRVAGTIYGAADTTLDNSTRLYTDGDELEASCPPQFRTIAYFNDRIWGIDADFPKRVWYTKVIQHGEGPMFNDTLVLDLDDDYGDCTALAARENSIVFFKREAIYALAGDGPDDKGNNPYLTPQRIHSGLGTTNQRSVIAYPGGIGFESTKGIWGLNAGLAQDFLGRDVYDTLGAPSVTANVVDAIHVDYESQIRFYLSTGTCLVFDYSIGEWFTRDAQTTIAAVKYGSTVAQATSAAVWSTDSTSNYADGSSSFAVDMITSWFSFAGVLGYKRIYEIQLMGYYVGAHYLVVDLSYDYNEDSVATESLIIEAAALAGTGIPYRISIKPANQKCSAIRLRIRDASNNTPTYGTQTGSFRLSAIAFNVGIKGRAGRLPSSNRMGQVAGGES